MDSNKQVEPSAKRKPPAAGRGRKKGELNKTTRALKDAILNAFETVGGESYLVGVARDDPRTFCTLLGKVMPMQVEGAGDDGEIKIAIEWQKPSGS
jgi:hypothetical protein